MDFLSQVGGRKWAKCFHIKMREHFFFTFPIGCFQVVRVHEKLKWFHRNQFTIGKKVSPFWLLGLLYTYTVRKHKVLYILTEIK